MTDSKEDGLDAVWRALTEKDDRTSPEEYPDMVLITRDELRDAVLSASSPPVGGSGEVVAWRSVVSDPPVAVSVLARFFDNELGEWVYTTFDPGPVSLTMAGPYSEWLPLDTFNRPLAVPVPNGVPEGWKLPDDNDGIEQDAFEEWAASERYDMEQHPLFYIFMDSKTNAARNGWRAGIRHARDRYRAMLAVSPVTPEGLSGGDGWQDISTAPKDGTWFLGWRKTRNPEDAVEVWHAAKQENGLLWWQNAADSSLDEEPEFWRPMLAPPPTNTV